jgi:hypothetical protein
MRPSAGALRERLAALGRVDDPPWRIALALALGVFISFTPFWGVQTLLSLLAATLLRLNKAVTVTGAWLNLPWFAPFVYAGALALGRALVPGAGDARALTIALLVGTTVLGAAVALVAWLVAFGVISHRRSPRRPKPDTGAPDRHAA